MKPESPLLLSSEKARSYKKGRASHFTEMDIKEGISFSFSGVSLNTPVCHVESPLARITALASIFTDIWVHRTMDTY